MSTTTSTKALVILCDGKDDYFTELFDIADDSETSAKSLAQEVAGDDLMSRLHCVWVDVTDGQSFRFERDELREVEG